MKKLITSIAAVFFAALVLCPYVQAKTKLHLKPFGWATCTSLSGGAKYNLNGGGRGRKIVLKSDGFDMHDDIAQAVEDYDVIVLDGSAGVFELYSSIRFKGVKNKTIVGINGAVLKTRFDITPDLRQALVNANLTQYTSKSGSGSRLSNGRKVNELREQMTRQTIIDFTGDQEETYRNSGLFIFLKSENVIIRNIDFIGPGAVDLGADDLLTLAQGSKHFWVDHCCFTDGMDGNMDIVGKSDFVTVSWCRFQYTDKSWDHCYSNLIAASDEESQGVDNLNVTFYACEWGSHVHSRTPMARFGTVHELNCYFNCPGKGDRINPRKQSEFLIENCYFAEHLPANFFRADMKHSPAKAWTLKNNIYLSKNRYSLENNGDVRMPYRYEAFPASEVPEIVHKNAGPVLKDPLKF